MSGVAALILLASAVDMSMFCLVCRNSVHQYNIDKGFEVVIGCNVTYTDLQKEGGVLNSLNLVNRPLCSPLAMYAIPLIVLEFIKIIFTIFKYYYQLKKKYIKDQKLKRKKIIPLKQSQLQLTTLPKRANSLPNKKDSFIFKKTINLKRLSIQTPIKFNSNHTQIRPFPIFRILLKTFKRFIFRSNFMIFVFITVFAIIGWSSIAKPNTIVEAEIIFGYFIPVFLFLTDPKLKKIFSHRISQVFPQN